MSLAAKLLAGLGVLATFVLFFIAAEHLRGVWLFVGFGAAMFVAIALMGIVKHRRKGMAALLLGTALEEGTATAAEEVIDTLLDG